MNLLHVDSSILGRGSVSRTLSADIVAALRGRYTALDVGYLDLACSPLGHLTSAHLPAARDEGSLDDALAADVAAGHATLEAFLAADIVVIGAPMYNFGVPSQLKAWIDRITVTGRTFRFGERGPVGLCGGKRVIVASSRGGVFSGDSFSAFLDHQETYLKALFGFLGVTDIAFVRAEGVALGPEARRNAIAAAREAVAGLVA
nr:FMN-dependent NADH-azoreductase 1 [Paraburkholderia busanensis]